MGRAVPTSLLDSAWHPCCHGLWGPRWVLRPESLMGDRGLVCMGVAAVAMRRPRPWPQGLPGSHRPGHVCTHQS